MVKDFSIQFNYFYLLKAVTSITKYLVYQLLNTSSLFIIGRFTKGMIRNWQKKPMAGPIGLLNVLRHTFQSMAQPKLIYKMDTSIATLIVNIVSIVRSSRITVIRDSSWLTSE